MAREPASLLKLPLSDRSDVTRTPYGLSAIVLSGPVHAAFSGGAAAKMSPASGQSMGHACTCSVTGGRPKSKMGEGSAEPAMLGVVSQSNEAVSKRPEAWQAGES